MGYTTDFRGGINIEPVLCTEEIEYLLKFADTRRMLRKKGDYFVDGTGVGGQGRDPDIIDYNIPPPEQPSLWCNWIPTVDGSMIEWDENEKFYQSAEWMWYLIQNFLKPSPIAKLRFPKQFTFLEGHICNGEIDAQGEESDDRWCIVVKNNVVIVKRNHFDSSRLVENKDLALIYCYETNKQSEKCNTCDNRFKCYTKSIEPKLNYGKHSLLTPLPYSLWDGL